MISFGKRDLKHSAKAVTTQAGMINEDFDALLKKLQTTPIGTTAGDKVTSSVADAAVIKQKDDVVYIADPSPDWRYWSPLKIGGDNGSLSITISLQKDQAIALLLRKYNALGSTAFTKPAGGLNVKVKFGSIGNALGQILKEGGSSAGEYELDISKNLEKTKHVQRTLVKKQLFTGHMRLDLA